MGYGIRGLGTGLQAGMSMGMQMRSMQWQNEEKKKLDKAKEDTKVALNDFFGSSFGQTMITGGSLSAQDKTMFMTALQGATAEARGIMGAVHSAWQQGDRETYNREMDRLNIYLEFYSKNKFDIENMEAAFSGIEQTFTHPDAINAAKAGRNLMASREQPMETERLDVAVTAFGPKSKAAIAEANKLLGTDYKAEDVTEEQGKIVHKAAITLNNAAALGESSFTAVLNQMKLDSAYKEAGIDLESISFKSWTTEPAPAPEAPGVRDVAFTVDKIKNAETVEDAQVLANAIVADQGDLSSIGVEGKDISKYWGENQTYILGRIQQDITSLVNEKGFVRPDELTERDLLGVKQTMTNAEWYKALAADYMSLYDELKALGVDMSQFKKLKNMEDITKITGFAPKAGIKTGDWRPEGWFVNE